jgi:hypothetical protein
MALLASPDVGVRRLALLKTVHLRFLISSLDRRAVVSNEGGSLVTKSHLINPHAL